MNGLIPLRFYISALCGGQEEFGTILERLKAAGIPYRCNVLGSVDYSINTQYGGSVIYGNKPDGHQWKMLIVNYAHQA
jgi:hypothetical protein